MKYYYKISDSLNENEIGLAYPQVQKMTKGYDYHSSNSVHNLHRCRHEFPEFEPNLHSFVLNKKAKLTDSLSTAVISGCGFLISERFKEVLEKFVLVPVRYYAASVVQNKTIHPYFWMHIVGHDFSERVDYKISTFYIDYFGTKVEEIQINSLNDFLDKRKEVQEKFKNRFLNIKIDKIVIDNSVSKYGLFSIKGFDFNYYVSQELYDAIIDNKLSGWNLDVPAHIFFSDL